MPDVQSPDAMKDLVKFVICLAVIGTVIALAAYFLVIQPAQVLTPPTNHCTYYHTIIGDWWSCS